YLAYTARPSTGPYKVDVAQEERIVATRNPHFPLTPASIASVELHHFEDRDALRAALLRGEIDLTTPNALSTDDLEAFEDHSRLRAVETPSAGFVFLGVGLRASPWNAQEARHALLQAIDRPKLAALEWGDAGRAAALPSLGEAAETLPRVAHDAEGAHAAFEALGLVGTEIALRWSPPLSQRFVEAVAADLAAAGLAPRLERVQSTWPMWSAQDFDGL